jgi:hypothetical protein
MLAPTDIRYIKLGRGGRWDDLSLDHGELHFGHGRVGHELGLSGTREQIKQQCIAKGRDPRAAGEDGREVLDFYRLGPHCLWITFARGHLWWTFAHPEVEWLGDGGDHGERFRRSIGGWSQADINGVAIPMGSLSTKLTQLASYRRTICEVSCEDYLIRRINGLSEPLVIQSNQARDKLVDTIAQAIKSLHWADFETLVDVMFARSGFFRTSVTGGIQKSFDLILEQPVLRERCAVQVKAAAGQQQLDEFVDAADGVGSFDRLFFVCHTPRGKLVPLTGRPDVYLWAGRELAAMSVSLGLADWIVEKTL